MSLQRRDRAELFREHPLVDAEVLVDLFLRYGLHKDIDLIGRQSHDRCHGSFELWCANPVFG
jgi:hypothetical protein